MHILVFNNHARVTHVLYIGMVQCFVFVCCLSVHTLAPFGKDKTSTNKVKKIKPSIHVSHAVVLMPSKEKNDFAFLVILY